MDNSDLTDFYFDPQEKPDLESMITFDYAAFLSCGCMVGLIHDTGNQRVKNQIEKWKLDRLQVERMSVYQVRKFLGTKGFGCHCFEKMQKSLF